MPKNQKKLSELDIFALELSATARQIFEQLLAHSEKLQKENQALKDELKTHKHDFIDDDKQQQDSSNLNNSLSTSVSRRVIYGVLASWIGSAISIFAGLFLTPILFRLMGKEELGIWYLFGNSQSFLAILGLGIIPTLSRYIAFSRGKSITSSNIALPKSVKQEISDWVITGRTILFWLSLGIFFVALLSGYGFITRLELKTVSIQTVTIAWAILCLSYAVSVCISYFNCWLTGIGYVGIERIINSGLSLLTIILSIFTVQNGGGIVGLAIVSLTNALLGRIVYLLFVRWQEPGLLLIKGVWNNEYAKKMIKPSLLWWLTDVGAFLILRTDTYFIALLRNTEDIASYQATYTLIYTLYSLSITFASASVPFISHAWQAQDLKSIHTLTLRNAQIGLSIMASGFGFMLLFGQEFIGLWIGERNFIGYGVLIPFCIMLTLEVQHVVMSMSSRATNDEKYVLSALASGLLNLVFTWLLINPFGLAGVALGTLAAQLITNNWYAVYRPLIRLKISFYSYFRGVIMLWGQVFGSCLILSWLAKQVLIYLKTSNAIMCMIGFMLCVAVLLLTSWTNILQENEKSKLKLRFLAVTKIR